MHDLFSVKPETRHSHKVKFLESQGKVFGQ